MAIRYAIASKDVPQIKKKRFSKAEYSSMKRALTLFAVAILASPLAMAYDPADPYADPTDGYDQGYVPQYGQPAQPYSQPIYGQPAYSQPQPVYQADDCIGAVVAGVCHGAVNPAASARQPVRCYGAMVGGQCTGPQF